MWPGRNSSIEGSAACILNTAACPSDSLGCDDSADCGGGSSVCCGNPGPPYKANCMSLTACAGSAILCNPTVNDCPTGTCKPFAKLPGYYSCQ